MGWCVNAYEILAQLGRGSKRYTRTEKALGMPPSFSNSETPGPPYMARLALPLADAVSNPRLKFLQSTVKKIHMVSCLAKHGIGGGGTAVAQCTFERNKPKGLSQWTLQ